MISFFKGDKFLEGFNNHFLEEINSTLPYYGPLMYIWTRALRSKYILEIGIEQGYTSYQFAVAAKKNNGRYYGIDIEKGWIDKFSPIIKKENLPAQLFIRDSKEIKDLSELNIEKVDFAFLDGEHSTEAVLHEVDLIYPKLSSGGWGYIFIHDIVDMGNAGAWLNLIKDNRFEALGLNANYGLGILRKKEGLDYKQNADKWEIKSLTMSIKDFLTDMSVRNKYKKIIAVRAPKSLLQYISKNAYLKVNEPVPFTPINKVDIIYIEDAKANEIRQYKNFVREGGMIVGNGYKEGSEVLKAVKANFDWINTLLSEDGDKIWWRYL